MNLFLDPNAPIEPDQIGAAAEEHVLAVVDDLIDTGMAIGAGPAAEIAAPLDELDAEPGLGQSAGRAHAGHASADYDHRLFRAWRQVIPFLDSWRVPLLSSPKRLGVRSRTSAELVDVSGARTYDPRYNQTAF
jgi:hypothetical protein